MIRPFWIWLSASLIAALVLFSLPASFAQAVASPTLISVKTRGKLLCGVSPIAPGFSYLDDHGARRGFDIDICRAVAAAVLGDAGKVEYVPLDTNIRFQAVQSGEVDLLSAQTTWTLSRDASLGLDFGPVVFYDLQRLMMPAKLKVNGIKDLSGAAICLLSGTTNLQNLEDFLRPRTIVYDPVVFENADEWRNAFFSGRCDAISADSSVLVSVRSMAHDPHEYVFLSDVISQEPLSPAMRQNDSVWRDIVSWTFYALVTAERKGIKQDNIDTFAKSNDPEIQRLLGESGEFGRLLGIDNRWAYHAIKATGNYGEVFDRNLGRSSPLGLERGLNKLWTEGGLIYSPPFR